MGSDSYIFNGTPAYYEAKYNDYKANPASVDEEMQKFFEGFDLAISSFSGSGLAAGVSPKELQVYALVESYRAKGHLIANTNPIRPRKDRKPHLDLADFGLTEDDLKSVFISGKNLGLENPTLENIIAHLKSIYCQLVGIEYSYVHTVEQRKWIQERFEKESGKLNYSIEKKKRILEGLTHTSVFEKFLNTKYVGQKRFSLEGGESFIPALQAIIDRGADEGVQEFIIGMAHRGRLNVLANIMKKTYGHIFGEFEGNMTPDLTMGDGDVKYHLGYSSQIETPSKKTVHLKLVPNPSHLEAVNPVVEGFARAKADILYNSEYDSIMPILIHGDAALPGQGVGYEVAQMAQLKGYRTGGTIHFVINNQIGFTTDFDDARSSSYSTSMASIIEAPVLHVNGDDVESVVFAVEFAVAFRQEFNHDCFIDMVCYRKHGHNEADEPKFTQPVFYKMIEAHDDPRVIYINKLVAEKSITADEGEEMNKAFWQILQDRLDNIKQTPLKYEYQQPEIAWQALRKATAEDFEASPDTAITKKQFDTISQSIMQFPADFKPLVKVEKMLQQKQQALKDGVIDWATAELTAYGSILADGGDVRLSGQDVKRGTFSHRHAMIYDTENNNEYSRLSTVKGKGQFRIYNSLLSEFAVLGFEYGYSLSTPDNLVLWEAQFGDFSNGAQTMIDQFITSSETKWQRMSGLVMLLPHGYEGQGPEHSSARLERYLAACAEFNITVANITTPANFFHALRRQLARPFRKPLVVMSPKSLLRHPKCVSTPDEFTKGGFKEILDDTTISKPKDVKKVLLCSGKVYYDLAEYQEQNKRTDVAIVRLEQLYPLAGNQLQAIFDKYPNAKKVWVQEEPENMGSWYYILNSFSKKGWACEAVTRKASASPATGYQKVHVKEQAELVAKAFA